MKRFLSPIALGAVALMSLAAGCSDAGPRTGTLAVRLTDAPFPTDQVQSVDVFVVRIDVKQGDASDAETETTSASETEVTSQEAANGWTTIASPNASFDLLTLQDGISTALGQSTVPAGNYHMMRLVIDPDQSSLTLKDGTVLNKTSTPDVSFPSAAQSGIKVVFMQPLVVDGGGTTTATLDFDVGQSFVLRGSTILSDGLTFKPVIRATTVQQ